MNVIGIEPVALAYIKQSGDSIVVNMEYRRMG